MEFRGCIDLCLKETHRTTRVAKAKPRTIIVRFAERFIFRQMTCKNFIINPDKFDNLIGQIVGQHFLSDKKFRHLAERSSVILWFR